MNDKTISLGDKRIRISAIKEYGIATKNVYYQKIYQEKVKKGFLSKTYSYEWHGEKERIGTHLSRADKDFFHFHEAGAQNGDKLGTNWSKRVNRQHIIVEQEKYMYVETYNRDVWHFLESNTPFDIEEKCRELDELFNGN